MIVQEWILSWVVKMLVLMNSCQRKESPVLQRSSLSHQWDKLSLKEKLKSFKWESINFILKRTWLKHNWINPTLDFNVKIICWKRSSTIFLKNHFNSWNNVHHVKKLNKIMNKFHKNLLKICKNHKKMNIINQKRYIL